MSESRSLLVELGTEELPPKALDALSEAFARGVSAGLKQHGIAHDEAATRRFCTPRRLAVHVPAVAAVQPEQSIERRGPAVKAGRDAEGKPTRALLGFAGSCGVEVDALDIVETDKGAWYIYRAVQPGKRLAEILPSIVEQALRQLPIPRPMRWADHDYAFVRPVHWLLMLHGSEVVDARIMGLQSGRQSRGHRFHHPAPVHVADADAWLGALREARVLADPLERRQRVREEVSRVAADLGGQPRLSDELLDEIANLTEWPVAIACTFDEAFLAVPPEALVTTMESNQKFVPVFATDGKLARHFIGVANIQSSDPQQVRKGYERVIRPRFADARFFWDEDLKTPLEHYQQALERVTYQQDLGSMWDKCVRVAELARVTANRVGVDAALATRAAALAKCDLMTRMVGEFPELQGVMGRYYAKAHGENEDVADALDAFYQPRSAGDAVASRPLARVLAVAERLDTLAGIFAVGLKPTGNKDPFALRRAALGLARTLIEGALDIDLKAAFAEALQLLPDAALAAGLTPAKGAKAPHLDAGKHRMQLQAELYAFVLDRLRGYYADKDVGNDLFEAVAAVAPGSLFDFDRRLRAVASFAVCPESQSLVAANKRVDNILRKDAGMDSPSALPAVDTSLFELTAERDLHAALLDAREDSSRLVDSGDYEAALLRLSRLQEPVDRFFDQVMVMAEAESIRRNRLALLRQLQAQFLDIADISRMHS